MNHQKKYITVDSKNFIEKFWKFLKEDSWQSWFVSLILLVVLIKFILFPILSFLTYSSLPLVVVKSCSMYHNRNFDDWWAENSGWYLTHGITEKEFKEFSSKNGLNKGDIIFVWGRSKPKLGDVIIFQSNEGSDPVIHRVISTNPYSTKGDNNAGQLKPGNNLQKIDETSISEKQIIGKAVFRIPVLGWVKLIFFEPLRPANERGLCRE